MKKQLSNNLFFYKNAYTNFIICYIFMILIFIVLFNYEILLVQNYKKILFPH